MRRTLSLFYFLAYATAETPTQSTTSVIKHTPLRAVLPSSTSSSCTTSTTRAPPPLAQPGDLASYGDDIQVAATPSSWYVNSAGETVIVEPGTLITVADVSQFWDYKPPPSTVWSTVYETTTWGVGSETSVPFPAPLSSLASHTDATTSTSISFLVPYPSVSFGTASADDSAQLPSTAGSSVDDQTGYAPPFTPTPTSAVAAPVFPADLGFTPPNGTSTPAPSALASASSALESCAKTEDGIQRNGHIEPGCKSFFEHVTDCFALNEPWDNPYDSARNENYRACVCMASPANPFSEYSALWKNFSGCAACIFTAIDGDGDKDSKGTGLDISTWATQEVRRLWSFCRAQEPNAYLFTLSLRDWFAVLADYLNVTVSPFQPAWATEDSTSSDNGDGKGGMDLLSAHYTGRPPLANFAWGSSAVSGWALAGVSPRMSTFVTAAEVLGAVITGPASRLVEWVEDGGKVEFNGSAADAREEEKAEELLQRALCLGGGRCEKSGAPARRSEVWRPGVIVAVLIAAALVWM